MRLKLHLPIYHKLRVRSIVSLFDSLLRFEFIRGYLLLTSSIMNLSLT
jgi:hypothetical protein